LVGLYPMDNQVVGSSAAEKAASIYQGNVRLIDSAKAILADISPFRGPNMDPGTAWEIGYGIARGLPVFAWTDDASTILARTNRLEGTSSPVDANGWSIEGFGLTENLMITVSAASVHDSVDAAIAACVAALRQAIP
jgi:nucleoside 2-deoxyribosyltransferase